MGFIKRVVQANRLFRGVIASSILILLLVVVILVVVLG